jgi:hypothetical protein
MKATARKAKETLYLLEDSFKTDLRLASSLNRGILADIDFSPIYIESLQLP